MAGWLGDPVSIITVLAPIFTIVIGSADWLHFVSHVQDSRSEGKGTAESLVSTLRMVGVPMIIATVTSMAGFLSLLVMNTAAIHDLAIFASLGILLAGLASWYVLPVILVGGIRLGGSDVGAGDESSGGRPRDRADDQRRSPTGVYPHGPLRFLPLLWGRPSVAAALVFVVFGVVGLQFLSTQFSQLAIFRQRTDVHKSFERVMEVNNGSIPVYLLIESRDDLLAPDRGLRILCFEEELAAAPEVGKVVSAYDAFALVNAGMFGGTDGGAVYPESIRMVDAIWSLISGQGNRVSRLINRDAGAARLIVFPLLISLRAFLPAFVSLLPIAAATLVIFGFMGIAGIPLSLFTATMFSITIGIGIDYAVHFTSVWKRFTGDGAFSMPP